MTLSVISLAYFTHLLNLSISELMQVFENGKRRFEFVLSRNVMIHLKTHDQGVQIWS